MDIKSLMIGDWVNYRGICNRIAPADFCHFEWIDELEPIPLTAEILEKNGWVEDGYFYRHKELGYIQLGKLFEHASFDFTKNGINYRIQTSPRCMKYIHQFQHALRLCGISKEIEL